VVLTGIEDIAKEVATGVQPVKLVRHLEPFETFETPIDTYNPKSYTPLQNRWFQPE
jgi:hypothetical protein